MSEVQRDVRESLRGEGEVTGMRCHPEKMGVWSCTVLFADRRVDLIRAVWYQSERTLGVSVVHRFAR